MTNTNFLSQSVEAGRLASAEAHYEAPTPESELVRYLIKENRGDYYVTLRHPWSLPVFNRWSNVHRALKLSNILSIYRCTEQTNYIITPTKKGTAQGVEDELAGILLPF